SQEIIDIAKTRVYNIHASILPKYRGASPINYAILNGEKRTGITIMKTDAGIDTGDIILQKEIDILENETAGELFERLSVLGAECIKEFLENFDKGFNLKKQDNDKATFSKIIKKEDAFIDFNLSADSIVNMVRAYNPSPIAYTFLNGEPFKIYKAEVSNMQGDVGVVLKNDNELVVGCLGGSVKLNVVQKAGGKQLSACDFLRGNKIPLGYKFSK
ncbi:MAG: methionyl-tRNA formyltransferase, partial [Clostridia bacterium]|nr:methionyl-tRNA formyltransferase [Clostridia bacterium]